MLYNMKDVRQRLSLFLAILHFKLTPVEFTNDLRFSQSKYCVQNDTKVRTRKIETSGREAVAISTMSVLLSDNVKLAKTLLAYCGYTGF